ncbi:DUF2752 domain-containing protein [Granulicella arctica]|uniref:DUF2752 domain-containing protein n=1 Tax=Granulicella arctica TaxID=940613 RepID=A0A7Y9TRH1_9BACT|nr:DUF2752 domain-containing protein [Granulicella arctica]NYF78193.1 hypothetical protein [Granulicella arctica]
MKQRRRTLVASASAGVAAGTALLLRFPPAQYHFYPRCPIHEYLHLQCPGCGSTRALAALLHGHLTEAMHQNALFVALLPLLAGYAALCCYRAWTAEAFCWPELPRWAVQSALALALVFTVTRNLLA